MQCYDLFRSPQINATYWIAQTILLSIAFSIVSKAMDKELMHDLQYFQKIRTKRSAQGRNPGSEDDEKRYFGGGVGGYGPYGPNQQTVIHHHHHHHHGNGGHHHNGGFGGPLLSGGIYDGGIGFGGPGGIGGGYYPYKDDKNSPNGGSSHNSGRPVTPILHGNNDGFRGKGSDNGGRRGSSSKKVTFRED